MGLSGSMTYRHKMETVKNVFGTFVDLKECPWIFCLFLIVCSTFQILLNPSSIGFIT